MLTIRVLTLCVLALGLSSPALAGERPIEQVFAGGDNNRSETTYLSCDSVYGCFDGNGGKCSDNPAEFCRLARVPEGRCTRGTGPCIWPQGAGTCVVDPTDPAGTAHAPLVPCLPDDPNDRTQTSGQFFSTLCPGWGQCEMSTNDPSCQCQGKDPAQSDWEGIICSLTANSSKQAWCSDGGKIGDQVVDLVPEPGVTIGAFSTGLCSDIVFLGVDSLSNCGSASRFPGLVATPTYSVENEELSFTLQRKPGTGLSLPLTPIQRVRSSYVSVQDDVGTGDFAQWGIRRGTAYGDSYSPDVSYASKNATGSTVNLTTLSTWCDTFTGWATHQPIRPGVCTDAVTACVQDSQCPVTYTCDRTNVQYCHESTRAPHALIFTRDITTTELSAAGKLGVCPPDCGLLHDFDTFELEAIVGVGSPPDAADERATVQLALDNLEGPRAGRGDMISISPLTLTNWFLEDPRCYIGGDPYIREGCNPCKDDLLLGCCAAVGVGSSTADARCAPVSDPAGDAQCAAKIGRCSLDSRPCNPTIGGASECGAGSTCDFCGGTYDGVGGVLPGLSGTYVDCPSCVDPISGNGLALPVGYNTHGFSEIDLVAHPRTSVLNNIGAELVFPFTFIWSSGAGAATFLDSTCDFPVGGDSCQLGESDGGDTGIGTGGSFTTAQKPTFDPSGPNFQYNVSWGPHDPGTVLSSHTVNDVGPGPDGIPGCIGDNSTVGYKTPCDQRLGNAADPGSTGTDDVAVLADFSAAQDGSDMRPAVKALWKISDPFADSIVFNLVSATAERDLDILGLTDNDDISLKVNLTYCPIVGSLPDCTRHELCHDRGGDLDGDGICNDDDSDLDGDGVDNIADNCVQVANPAASYPGTRTTTGGQLDDDADGYGNLCDAKFTPGPIVTALDTIQYKGAISKPILASTCGSPATRPCDVFDLDGVSPVITAIDTIRFKAMLSKPVGPKCAACPLACVGDACP